MPYVVSKANLDCIKQLLLSSLPYVVSKANIRLYQTSLEMYNFETLRHASYYKIVKHVHYHMKRNVWQLCFCYETFIKALWDDKREYLKEEAWRSGLHVRLVMWRSWVQAPSKAHVVSLSKKLYSYCLVLVGSRNRFERDFTIKQK